MISISGIAIRGNKHYLLDSSNISSITLPKSSPYLLGFDPSSECTGVAITNAERSFNIILDIYNKGFDLHEFIDRVRKIVNNIIKGVPVGIVALEKHYMKGKYTASQALIMVRSAIINWKQIVPEFSDAHIGEEFPQSWRSHVIDKSKNKGRFHKSVVKYSVAEDLCDKYPALTPYLSRCSKNFDSFEALGILEGFLAKNTGVSGLRKVNSSMASGSSVSVFYWLRFLPIDDIKQNKIWDKLDSFKEVYGVKQLEYNTSLSFEENARRAVAEYDIPVYMVIPPCNDYLWMMWEYDIPLTTDKAFIGYFARKTKLTKVSRDVLMSREKWGVI